MVQRGHDFHQNAPFDGRLTLQTQNREFEESRDELEQKSLTFAISHERRIKIILKQIQNPENFAQK